MIQYFIINNASRAANYGVGTYIKQLFNCLKTIPNIQISMIDLDADAKEYSISEDKLGCTHYLIPHVDVVEKYEAYCRNAFYFLIQHIDKEKGDSIIFHFNYFLHYDLAIRLKTYLPKCKIVIAVHYLSWCFDLSGNVTKFRSCLYGVSSTKSLNTADSDYTSEDRSGASENLYKGVIESYDRECEFLRLADAVVVLSENTKDIIIDDYHINRNKIHVLQNGLEDIIENDDSGDDKHVAIPVSKRNVLFVGRLDKIKGVRYLIKAFKILYMVDHSLHLYLVGDGDFSSHLSEVNDIWDAVTITGKIEKKYAERYYHKATIGVLPSFHEQCSYTAIEMMMHGIPLVGTDSTGLCEMLKYTPDNIVHIDENKFKEDSFIAELSQKMKRLLYDSDYYKHSSLLMRQAYLDYYSIDRMRINYNNLLNRLICEQKILSDDIISTIDRKMFTHIDKRPEIDFSFFGMTGIGYYLWRRISLFKNSQESNELSYCLFMQEYLIYYLDWVIDEIGKLTIQEREMIDMEKLYSFISELNESGFYKTAIRKIICMLGINICMEYDSVQTEDIYANALRIYNYE